MPRVDMQTHGLDWKRRFRRTHVFVCLVSPGWHTDRRCQRQLAYARQLGKPVYFLVQPGETAPALQGEHVVHCASPRDAARALDEIGRGER